MYTRPNVVSSKERQTEQDRTHTLYAATTRIPFVVLSPNEEPAPAGRVVVVSLRQAAAVEHPPHILPFLYEETLMHARHS